MKRLFILFFLIIALSALYLSIATCKEGARSSRPITMGLMQTKLASAQKQYKLNKQTNKRVAKKE
jgi:hypothetical protein